MKYFIGYLGDPAVQKYYDAITSELAGKFGIRNLSQRVPAHMTLKSPFGSREISGIELQIEKFLENWPAIPFSIEGFDKFENDFATIFLSAKTDAKLDQLVSDLIAELEGIGKKPLRLQHDAKEFRLHMSIARHLERVKSDQVWNYLTDLPKPKFELMFDNITLFVLEKDAWKIGRVFRLR